MKPAVTVHASPAHRTEFVPLFVPEPGQTFEQGEGLYRLSDAAQFDALRRYFLAHETAHNAISEVHFAACMADANRAAQELRRLQFGWVDQPAVELKG